MVKTRGYRTKEEATEAWNTWAGGNRAVSQDDFNRLNEAIERDSPIEHGKLVLPDGENAFGNLTIADEGGYEHPWPKIYITDYANAESGLYGDDDMFLVYKLRARWRLVENDHVKLRRQLLELLSVNDRENAILNKQLQKWNELLKNSGFPEFKSNDLRGVDLSGLTISKLDGSRVWLRGVDFSYSECHLLRLVDANLYGATFVGVKATQMDISYSTAHGVSFQASYLSDGKFVGTDLGFCNFNNALLSHCVFDGANCHRCDFSSALLLKASFDHLVTSQSGKRIYSNLSEAISDENTRFSEVFFNEFLNEQNPGLTRYIQEKRDLKSVKEELTSSVEIKPGAFGFAVDLSRVFKTLKRMWIKGRSQTQQRAELDKK